MLRKNLTTYEEDVVQWGANSLYGGGTDTATVLTVFVLAMVLNPEVQKKAQEELDSVLEPGLLPTLGDRSRLPYMEALLLEILRFHPIGPMGIPHCVAQDDYYKGMFIPKDSIILVNLWYCDAKTSLTKDSFQSTRLIAHSPEIYTHPYRFDPGRFHNSDQPQLDPQAYVYGFGRRACPGRELANANIFLLMSMMLTVFNLTKAVDTDGNEITPEWSFGPGTVSHPQTFPFKIEPRSTDAEALIANIFKDHPLPPTNADDI
ncbi:hypothetical protein C0992_008664 [Termitomyces sp. T32_za158]|nr:hypothetical protein C0992_008664 [Termitomyces sp. T32_za158]